MGKLFIEQESLKAIADAIRAKTGSTEMLTVPSGMVSAISSISSGGEVSGTLDITENGTYNVAKYAHANVNIPIGVAIEVSELPQASADTVGKVYKVGEDYYVGEESVVGFTVGEALGDKIYFDTSVNPNQYMTAEPATVLEANDGSTSITVSCNKAAFSELLGSEGYGYMYAVMVGNTTFAYIDCDVLTVEQFNEIMGQMGISVSAFGWQLDECDTGASNHLVTKNDLSAYENLAYKSKTLTFKNLDNPPILQEKTVTENGEVVADSGYDGLSKVTVNVASTGGGEAQAVTDAFITRSLTEVESDVETIGDYAFNSCKLLKNVNIPNATSIGQSAFYACSTLNNVNFPNATSIGSSAFDACRNLQNANIPNLQEINNYAFRTCGLVSVNFPNATSIGSYAFYSNYYLITANLPNVTIINNFAFYFCNSLTKVIIGIKQTGVATLQTTNIFGNCNHIVGIKHSIYNPDGLKDGYIYVPHSLVADYRSATNWAEYATQIMPYVATVGELANIDGTTYDKACVGADYVEYTYNGTSWEVYR